MYRIDTSKGYSQVRSGQIGCPVTAKSLFNMGIYQQECTISTMQLEIPEMRPRT
jgi:hypothetical protein